MFYIRVETMSSETNETVGGYVSPSLAITLKMLGLPLNASAEELCTAIRSTPNKNVQAIYRAMSVLGGIDGPKIYKKNTEKYYCLYVMDEFFDKLDYFEDIDSAIREATGDKYYLIYRAVRIPNRAIVYKDKAQIVVSNEDYLKFMKKGDYCLVQDDNDSI